MYDLLGFFGRIPLTVSQIRIVIGVNTLGNWFLSRIVFISDRAISDSAISTSVVSEVADSGLRVDS